MGDYGQENEFVEFNKDTAEELVTSTKLSISSIKKYMIKLQELNFIERNGSKRNGYWILK